MTRRAEEWPRPAVTVDLVLFSLEPDPRVLLIRRAHDPFAGRWALPGGFVDVGDGFVDQGEDLMQAAHRELAEETGLSPERLRESGVALAQLGAWGAPGRDPRQRTITIVWWARVPADLVRWTRAGDDAAEARWWSLRDLDRALLAFDHADILEAAERRAGFTAA